MDMIDELSDFEGNVSREDELNVDYFVLLVYPSFFLLFLEFIAIIRCIR